MRAQLSEIFSLGSARLHNEAAMATCAHTHRETGRQNHPSRDRLRRSTVSWLVDRNECRYRVGLAQARLDQAETNGHSEPERTKQSQSSPTRTVPGTRPWLQVASVFSFLLRTVRFSHGLLVSVSASDWRRSAGRSACLSVGRFGFGYRVSAVHRSGLRCCLLSLPASLLLPLLPLLPRLSQRCSTKKAGRIQRNFWFSSVLCLDVIRSVREKCSPTSRYREIKSN